MAGRMSPRSWPVHRSRVGATAGFDKKAQEGLLSDVQSGLECEISSDDARALIFAVLLARAQGYARHSGMFEVTRKSALAQLRKMKKMSSDDELIGALRLCDRRTFEAISEAHTELISRVLFREGKFVDVDGVEHLIPPDIEVQPRPTFSTAAVYLPSGVSGLREAVNLAFEECGRRKDKAGNRAKPYQLDLAAESVRLGACYMPGECAAAWRWGDESPSRLVSLTRTIFRHAGMHVTDSRLVAILKKV